MRVGAPSRAVTVARNNILSSLHTKKAPRWDAFFVWRSRRDLNSRAGYPTYALSRGASSPLEYYSIYMVTFGI